MTARTQGQLSEALPPGPRAQGQEAKVTSARTKAA